MKCETKKYKVDTSKFTKEQLNYIDYERMEETLTKFIFPSKSDDMYEFIALFLKQQYNLEIKYLEPDIDSCSYISQKAPIFGNTMFPSNTQKKKKEKVCVHKRWDCLCRKSQRIDPRK